MPVFAPLRSDLRRILLSTPGLPVMAWEGRRFTPTIGVAWCGEKLIPVLTSTATLGTTGFQNETYIYALQIHQPAGAGGISELEDLADRLMYKYHVGLQVGGVNANGRVLKASRSQMIDGPDWMDLTVNITAFMYRPNVREPAA